MARHSGGWVKLYRKAVLGDIGSSFTRGGLFSAIVAMANIQDSIVDWGGRPRKLERGQIATSLSELASLGEVDRKTVLKHLNYLRIRETINIEISSQGAIVTVLNYERYQGQDAEWSHQGPISMDNGMDNGVPHNEEVKNKRTKEYSALDSIFDQLSKKYRELFPGTTIGSGARQRFNDQFKDVETQDQLETAIGHYRKALDFQDWRQPKTTFANFLGTKRSGFFWREFIDLPNLEPTPANIWDSKASQVYAAVTAISSNSSTAAEQLVQKLGPELAAIAVKVPGGTGAIRALPRNDFAIPKLAGWLKEAAGKVVAA